MIEGTQELGDLHSSFDYVSCIFMENPEQKSSSSLVFHTKEIKANNPYLICFSFHQC